MNTFDENPPLAHTCENCWQKVPFIFTYGDGFMRCLSCHREARYLYLPGGQLWNLRKDVTAHS